jgi:uncharacterized membrane protein
MTPLADCAESAILHPNDLLSRAEMTHSSALAFHRQLPVLARIFAWLFVGGLCLGFGLGLLCVDFPLAAYVSKNVATTIERKTLLGYMFGSTAVLFAVSAAYLSLRRGTPAATQQLFRVVRRLSPLFALGPLPLLFNWFLWKSDELTYLAYVLLVTLGLAHTLRERAAAEPLKWEIDLGRSAQLVLRALESDHPRLLRRLPFTLVALGALAYAVYFSYYTILFHQAARTGFDMGIENNLMWNLVHGSRPLFKSSPIFGAHGTHFGNHATLFAFVMAPIYALHQDSETLLIIQSTLLGAAAIPLFLFGRRHVGAWPACVIALAYLLYPPLHGANLFEFHYIPLGIFFLFSLLYLFETRRDGFAALVVLLTLSVREDVSSWVAIAGAYFLFSGRRPTLGLILGVVGFAYFATMKFLVMPKYGGAGESFTFIFTKLVPEDGKGFSGVLQTVFGNPGYTLKTLLDPSKLTYVGLLFLPVAFLPFRHPSWKFLFLPGFFFTLLSTEYGATVSMHFQYVAHWIAFLFPGAVLALASLRRRSGSSGRIASPLLLLAFTTVLLSYQRGAVFQHNTSYGGPLYFTFGLDAQGEQRREAVRALKRDLPANAKVSASGFLVPQLSSRADAYSLPHTIDDAEYLAFPSVSADYIGNEQAAVKRLLMTGEFGIVAVHPPFALAKRGAPAERNAEFVAGLR